MIVKANLRGYDGTESRNTYSAAIFPSRTPGVVEGLGLALRGVNEVRVGCAEIASKFAEGFGADEYAGRCIQHAVFSVEFLDRCSTARRVALAKDLLKIALKQFADMVGHRLSP